jgi:hypothetical protein
MSNLINRTLLIASFGLTGLVGCAHMQTKPVETTIPTIVIPLIAHRFPDMLKIYYPNGDSEVIVRLGEYTLTESQDSTYRQKGNLSLQFKRQVIQGENFATQITEPRLEYK